MIKTEFLTEDHSPIRLGRMGRYETILIGRYETRYRVANRFFVGPLAAQFCFN